MSEGFVGSNVFQLKFQHCQLVQVHWTAHSDLYAVQFTVFHHKEQVHSQVVVFSLTLEGFQLLQRFVVGFVSRVCQFADQQDGLVCPQPQPHHPGGGGVWFACLEAVQVTVWFHNLQAQDVLLPGAGKVGSFQSKIQ